MRLTFLALELIYGHRSLILRRAIGPPRELYGRAHGLAMRAVRVRFLGRPALQLHLPFVMIRAQELSLGFFPDQVITLGPGRRCTIAYDVRHCTIPLARAQD